MTRMFLTEKVIAKLDRLPKVGMEETGLEVVRKK